MSNSEVKICNRALLKIGEPPILALDNTSKASRNCGLVYPDLRDALLRMYNWKFAIARATLAEEVTTRHLGEFSFSYRLPADCLRLIEPNREIVHYRVEGQSLLTTTPIEGIKYIRNVTEARLFDSSFREVLIMMIAAELAISIPDNQNLLAVLRRDTDIFLSDARFVGAIEDGPSMVLAEDWLYSRYAGTSGPNGPYHVRW